MNLLLAARASISKFQASADSLIENGSMVGCLPEVSAASQSSPPPPSPMSGTRNYDEAGEVATADSGPHAAFNLENLVRIKTSSLYKLKPGSGRRSGMTVSTSAETSLIARSVAAATLGSCRRYKSHTSKKNKKVDL